MNQKVLDEQIACEMAAAQSLFEEHGEALRQQPTVGRLVSCYAEAIEDTQELLQQVGVSAACALCATQAGGSCCFEGIEGGYDRILLLINLLLGCPFPESRELSGSCLFVGKHGCRLRARYYFCVEYLCPALHARLALTAKETLRGAVARELTAGWELERAIRVWLRDTDDQKTNSFK